MTNLAPYNRTVRCFTPSVLIIVFCVVGFSTFSFDSDGAVYWAFGIVPLWFWLSRWLRANTYLFNEDVLHIRNKRSETLVPLADIYRVKMRYDNWRIPADTYQRYTIEYTLADQNEIVHFWVSTGGKGVHHFANAVKNANPDAVVEHWEDDDASWSEMYKGY